MKNNKLDIFEQNAEFFERFNNSLEDTANDRHGRTRFTVTGLENKVEFAVTNAQGRIKKAEDDAIANIVDTTQSVGTGKYLREGAYGLGTLDNRYGYETGSLDKYLSKESGFVNGMGAGDFNAYFPFMLIRRYNSNITLIGANSSTVNFAVYSSNTAEWTAGYSYSNLNTRTDKNNVLHSGTRTPINTLNVSDMAQDVVDRDDVTVTSGAVYRAIQELRQEIALLKGKLNE